jgi:predicted amidophosphoribosyltransferase
MVGGSQRCDRERVFPCGVPDLQYAASASEPCCQFARSAWRLRSASREKCEVCGQPLARDDSVRAILLLKWERIEPLGSWFAQRLAEIAEREGELLAGDVVVPVPLHRDRERERGYNQAGLISNRWPEG